MRILFVWFLCVSAAVGGGPLLFKNGTPIVWETGASISYRIDKGPLGALDAGTAQSLVQDSFRIWSLVNTSAVEFKFSSLLPTDISDAESYLMYEDMEADGLDNVVVFDEAGDIIADLAGEENRDKILGWAEPITDKNETNIVRFYSLINGKFASNSKEFTSTLVHEFGHAIGLDHAQIHPLFAQDGDKRNDVHIPTMFPTAVDDDAVLVSLNHDDEAWVSMLYPSGNTTEKKFGTVSGSLSWPGGKPVLGANLVLIDQRPAAKLSNRFSGVSDWTADENGEFKIPAYPGKYHLRGEPILHKFVGGSGVGPHSGDIDSPSFVNAISTQFFNLEVIVNAGADTALGKIVVVAEPDE